MSDNLIPDTIVLGKPNVGNIKKILGFGYYVMVLLVPITPREERG